jgi:hypothetical protein
VMMKTLDVNRVKQGEEKGLRDDPTVVSTQDRLCNSASGWRNWDKAHTERQDSTMDSEGP